MFFILGVAEVEVLIECCSRGWKYPMVSRWKALMMPCENLLAANSRISVILGIARNSCERLSSEHVEDDHFGVLNRGCELCHDTGLENPVILLQGELIAAPT